MFVPMMLVMPFVVVAALIVSGSPSTSLSLISGAIVTAVFFGVVAASLTATGGSFTGVTVTVISAEAVPPLPSLMLYPTVAVPLKFVLGVKTTLVALTIMAVPFVAATLTIVSG